MTKEKVDHDIVEFTKKVAMHPANEPMPQTIYFEGGYIEKTE